jgi:periplasmic protein CpxP/Spy
MKRSSGLRATRKNNHQNHMKRNGANLLTGLIIAGMVALSPLARAEDKPVQPAKPEVKQSEKKEQSVANSGDVYKEHVERLSKTYNFTEEQKTKVEAIFKAQSEKMKELGRDKNLSREDRYAKYKQLMEASNAGIKAVLTPEQAAKWEESNKRKNSRNAVKKPEQK